MKSDRTLVFIFIALTVTLLAISSCMGPANGGSPQPVTRTAILTPNITPILHCLTLRGTSSRDGMVMIYVCSGSFKMGSPAGPGPVDERPQHTVYLNAFWIDSTEVTNGMYALCVSAGTCQPPISSHSVTRSDYYGNAQYNKYPVVYVNWDMANRYCGWAGRRLPTEAEWEKAARGTDGRTYPWGNGAPNPNLLNYNYNKGDLTEAGYYPEGASPYGVYDMSGNVNEWVADLYDPHYYSISPQSNPTGPAKIYPVVRVVRSGTWGSDDNHVRSAVRLAYQPSDADYGLGFRCASSTSP